MPLIEITSSLLLLLFQVIHSIGNNDSIICCSHKGCVKIEVSCVLVSVVFVVSCVVGFVLLIKELRLKE